MIQGLHHVTAISSHPRTTVAFYRALGTELKPPPWLEADRAVITAVLPPLDGSAEHAESKVLDICAEPNTLGRTFRDLEGA